MQSIKPHDLTKLEEHGVWLAANQLNDAKPNPNETGNLPPPTPPAETDIGDVTPP